MPAHTPESDPVESLPTNPTDKKEFDTLKDDGTRYRVEHTAVGRHPKGSIVSAKDFGPGADLQRLKELGAITEAPKVKVRDTDQTARAAIAPEPHTIAGGLPGQSATVELRAAEAGKSPEAIKPTVSGAAAATSPPHAVTPKPGERRETK